MFRKSASQEVDHVVAVGGDKDAGRLDLDDGSFQLLGDGGAGRHAQLSCRHAILGPVAQALRSCEQQPRRVDVLACSNLMRVGKLTFGLGAATAVVAPFSALRSCEQRRRIDVLACWSLMTLGK